MFKWITQDKVTKAEIIEKKIYDKPVKSIYEQLRKVRSSSDDAKKVFVHYLVTLHYVVTETCFTGQGIC